MNRWRLLLSGENDALSNMAIDEAILEAHKKENSPPTLRIYGWNPAAITIGYAQKAEDILNVSACLREKVPFVRRMTGGEAIFHGDSISYSITCSKEDLKLPISVKEGFKIVTSFLIKAYERLGLRPSFFSERKKKCSTFCFAAAREFDIAIEEKKIGGNAQKRLRDTIFQHGSIPLKLDGEKIMPFISEDLSGLENNAISLEEAAQREVSFDEFRALMSDSFQKTFSVTLSENTLSALERNRSAVLRTEKYGSEKWNYSKVSWPERRETACPA